MGYLYKYTHNMHCMNLYVYQPLISTGLSIVIWHDALETPFISCVLNNHDGSNLVSNTCVLSTSIMLYIASTSGLIQAFILKASRVETTSQLWVTIMIKMFFNCLQRNLLLSWTCTTDLCFLRTMCKVFSRFYKSLR